MNARQFFDLVAQMRDAQKEYFALRKSGADKVTVGQALSYSIDLEWKVDKEIERVQGILKGQGAK